MTYWNVQLCAIFLVTTVQLVKASVYLHEPSAMEIRPDGESADFGFSIAYQNGDRANLVVGAPHTADSIGQVYLCSMVDVFNSPPKCTKIPIDFDTLAPDTIKGLIHPNQSFCLGASIAATPDYLLTCAPLQSTNVPYYYYYYNERSNLHRRRLINNTYAGGTCFVYDGRQARRYQGSLEQQKLLIANKFQLSHTNVLIGGTGWTTLVDHTNNNILIAKQSLPMGDVTFLSMSHPEGPTVSLVLNQTDNGYIRNIGHNYLSDYNNVGYGLAAGNFFSNAMNTTYYAISMQSKKNKKGQVIFLDSIRDMLQVRGNPVTVTGPTGSMFGAALCAADASGDGLAELLVGAPAHSEDDAGYDAGALFIYLGGDMENIDGGTKHRQRVILGSKDGSRFGTAIATSDIDGDGLPEIFVSAPYEESGTGAVYIFSGYDVRDTLINKALKKVSISDLRLTQRIYIRRFKAFGFSLQVVPDLDDNGCNELAIGAPGSGSVLLLKCVPTVNANVSTLLMNKMVREYDSNFTVQVCVDVKYHPKPINISTQLSVTSRVTGNGADIAQSKFSVDLSQRKERYCENIIVQFKYNQSGSYNFTAELDTLLLHEDAYLTSKTDFNNTWVTLSPHSKRISDSLYVTRHCAEEDCTTRLNMFLKWAGIIKSTANYTLGSSETEAVTVVVTNDGGATLDGCVRVRVSGAHVSHVACGHDHTGAGGGAYLCYLPRPMQRDAEYHINVTFNMSKYMNMDEKLHVEALLYETCSHENYNRTELDINLMLNAEDINVFGSSYNMNVTDTELLNEKTKTINDTHEYTIVNERSVKWKDINAILSFEKKLFIDKYKISATQNTVCVEQDRDNVIEFHCLLELTPYSTVKIIASTEIFKDKIVKSLQGNRIDISSNFSLSLQPTSETISKSLTTVIFYQKELSVANNKWLIILIAVILALILLGILVFILYKIGFFIRKSKARLDSLRQSIRSRDQSVRQSEPSTSEQKPIPEEDNDIDDIDMEVVDDCPFEPVDAQQCAATAADDAALIVEERKQENKKSRS